MYSLLYQSHSWYGNCPTCTLRSCPLCERTWRWNRMTGARGSSIKYAKVWIMFVVGRSDWMISMNRSAVGDVSRGLSVTITT